MLVAEQRFFTDLATRSSSTSSSTLPSSLLGISKLGISYLPTTPNTSPATKSLARIFTETEICDGGGTIVITYGFDDDELIEPGEYLDISFNNCILSGDSFNGTMRMTVKSWVSEFNFSMGTTFNLSTVVDGIAASSNGSMDIALMDTGSTTTITLSSSSMTGTVGTETTTMTNLNVVVTESSTGYTTDLSMNVSSNTIGGSVNIDTDPAFGFGPFDDYPNTGTLTVTGSDGTYVSLNADTGDLNTVILTVFDGTATTSDEIPWSQLETSY